MFLEVYPQVLGISTHKTCTECGELKPRDQFSKHKYHADGLSSHCKTCVREYDLANVDRRRERHREYYVANAERIKEQKREYRTANAERIREYNKSNSERIREWRVANADRIKEQMREYHQAHPDIGRAATHRRRARKVGNGGSHTAADLKAIRAAQTDKRGRLICWRCGKPIKDTPHIDHWIPLDKGGTNDPGNLHYMHARCNLKKAAKLPTEIGRLL